jgi:flagellar motility protein MotE (MotC chaperone)
LVAERYQRENPRRFSQVMAEMAPIHAAELTTRLRARAEALETTVEAEARRVVGGRLDAASSPPARLSLC